MPSGGSLSGSDSRQGKIHRSCAGGCSWQCGKSEGLVNAKNWDLVFLHLLSSPNTDLKPLQAPCWGGGRWNRMLMGRKSGSRQEDSLEGRPLSRLQETPAGWVGWWRGLCWCCLRKGPSTNERWAFLKPVPVIVGCGPAFLLSGVKDRAREIIQDEAVVWELQLCGFRKMQHKNANTCLCAKLEIMQNVSFKKIHQNCTIS